MIKNIDINKVLKNKILFCILSLNLFFKKLREKCDLILNPYAALSIPIHINKNRQDSSDHDRETSNKYLEKKKKKLIETIITKIIQSVDSSGNLNIVIIDFICYNSYLLLKVIILTYELIRIENNGYRGTLSRDMISRTTLCSGRKKSGCLKSKH